MDKSAQDVAAEGAILNEMLDIVAKRAALRPSEQSGPSDSISPPVSLPVLPPQTTINPLQQYAARSSRYQINNGIAYVSNRHKHTFSSQSHNQEHDVSDDDFLFDGTENYYLCTNLSLLHDCEQMLELYEQQHKFIKSSAPPTIPTTPQNNIIAQRSNAHLVLVIVEFLVLYFGILYYSFSKMQQS